MKRNKIISLTIAVVLIGISLSYSYATQNNVWKISGDIVSVEYTLKKPIALSKTDKKIDFKENDILTKISYIDRENNKKLTDVDISNRKDILEIQKLPDDIDIVAEIIRDSKTKTIYSKIYDLRNIIWNYKCSKTQVITLVNEQTKEAKLNWISYFSKELVKCIKVYKCDIQSIYKNGKDYKIINMDNNPTLIGESEMDYLGMLTCKINNIKNVKYIDSQSIRDNKYYMYVESIKDHEIIPFKVSIESMDNKYFKQVIIDDNNFKKVFTVNNIKSGIEGAPIVKNGEFIGSVTNIIKVKNKYIIMAKISE